MRVEEKKRKKVKEQNIKDLKTVVKERKKNKEEVLKKSEKLAAQVLAVKKLQKKMVKIYEAEVECIIKTNRNNVLVEDLIKLVVMGVLFN